MGGWVGGWEEKGTTTHSTARKLTDTDIRAYRLRLETSMVSRSMISMCSKPVIVGRSGWMGWNEVGGWVGRCSASYP